MTEIELVIRMPEEMYEWVNDVNKFFDDYGTSDFVNLIKNGTPLPKGHGDLIDRGKLKTHFIGTEQGTDLEVYLEPTIVGAKAIIKADTRSEVNNDHQNLERSL